MQLEKNTFEALINYLKIHGYPETSLAIEYQVDAKHRVDLAIIDPESNLPIQIFEIKSKDTKQIKEFGKQQLKTYLNTLNINDIPAYLVFPASHEPYFRIERISFDEEKNIELKDAENYTNYDFLNFSMQKQSRLSKKIEETKQSKKETIDKFSLVSWLLSGFVFLILLVVKFTSLSLSPVEFSLLGVSIALVIIPFASKLKFLGFEFERFQNEQKKSLESTLRRNR